MSNHAVGALRRQRARDHYAGMFPRLIELIDVYELSQDETAEILTTEGFRTLEGNPIHQACVSRWLRVARGHKGVTMPTSS